MSNNRRPRARIDAQRSESALVDAARTIFSQSGVDAPARDIAASAGVGVATLYRSFPKRADLVAAVFRREVDDCAAAAADISAEQLPVDALLMWLLRYARFIATKRGLATALHSGDPTFETLPEYFRSKFEPVLAGLLDDARLAAPISREIEAYDLLRAVGNLSVEGEGGTQHTERMVRLLVAGLSNG